MNENNVQKDLKEKQLILDHIQEYGCHLILIEPDNYLPGFVYSIGLFQKFNHPEIICFGLKNEVSASIINHALDLIKNGENLIPQKSYPNFLEGYEIQFIPVDKEYYQNYLGYAGWFYDMNFDFPALQLVCSDKQHKFPWEEDFNPDWKFKQPLLDRNIDFKFYEEKNVAVFTTKQVFNGDPILYVYHNLDGDWQFHSTTEPCLDDVMIVGLEQITKLDPTINNIYLQYGWNAWRQTQEDAWQYAKDEEGT